MLLYPLTQALLLMLLAAAVLKAGAQRAALYLLLGAAGWLYLCSTGIVAEFAMGSLERDFPPTAMSSIEAADAIVVLGGATRGDTHMSSIGDLNQQADRLLHTAALYKAGKAPLVLASGGSAPGVRPEAQLMQEILEVMGVPRRDIVLETSSRDTYDNAVFSSALLRERGVKRVLLVTSAFHMRRSMAVFAGKGLDVVPAPTDYQRLVVPPTLPRWLPTVESLQRTTYALREHAGYWVYRFRGQIGG